MESMNRNSFYVTVSNKRNEPKRVVSRLVFMYRIQSRVDNALDRGYGTIGIGTLFQLSTIVPIYMSNDRSHHTMSDTQCGSSGLYENSDRPLHTTTGIAVLYTLITTVVVG
jgi:hypothetical protein